MKTQIVSVDINAAIGRIWTERLPIKLPRGYCNGRKVRSFNYTQKRDDALWAATYFNGWRATYDSNGYHLRRPGF